MHSSFLASSTSHPATRRHGPAKHAVIHPGLVAVAVALPVLAAAGCDSDEPEQASEQAAAKTAEQESELPFGLSEEEASQVLAKVDGTSITLGDFARRLAEQSPYLRARYGSLERRREFLDDMIRFELLADEAKRQGFFDREDVKRLARQEMVRQLMKDVLEGSDKLSDVSDDAIERYYRAHQDEFHKPPQRRIAHIVFESKPRAQRVLKKLRARPHDMELFRAMVKKHSQDADTRETHGDLGFVSRPDDAGASQDVPAPVAAAAFELENTGDMLPSLVKSKQGWHIVKLTGKRPALNRSLEEARRIIQSKLWRERRQEKIDTLVAKLRDEANVQENLGLLEQVRVSQGTADTTPPGPVQKGPAAEAAGKGAP